MHYAISDTRALIALSGEDAVSFLQGLITNDAAKLVKGETIYAALLTPQGKYLHDFFLIPADGKILLEAEKSRLPDLMQRLKMYKLRSKVIIDELPDLGVALAWGNSALSTQHPPLISFPDPRHPQLGYRIIGDAANIKIFCVEQTWNEMSMDDYHRMRLTLGVPDGARDFTVERSILLYYGFEDLQGVDFKKGCYVGQEVMARAHYRGAMKKFLYQVRAQSALPAAGTPVYLGETLAGELLSSADNTGLAMLRLEEVEKSKAAATPLAAAGILLDVAIPGWVRHIPKTESQAQ